MIKMDASHIMRMKILKLKDEIEGYEKTIDDSIKKISCAEREIEAIKILLEKADFSVCDTPRELRVYENE